MLGLALGMHASCVRYSPVAACDRNQYWPSQTRKGGGELHSRPAVWLTDRPWLDTSKNPRGAGASSRGQGPSLQLHLWPLLSLPPPCLTSSDSQMGRAWVPWQDVPTNSHEEEGLFQARGCLAKLPSPARGPLGGFVL